MELPKLRKEKMIDAKKRVFYCTLLEVIGNLIINNSFDRVYYIFAKENILIDLVVDSVTTTASRML